MIKSIIDKAFLSNRALMEGIKPTENYLKLLEKAESLEKGLMKDLNEEQNNKFTEYISVQSSMESDSSEQLFAEGIKLGLCLAVECFED